MSSRVLIHGKLATNLAHLLQANVAGQRHAQKSGDRS